MADDEAQGHKDSLRPAFDASTDSSLPSAFQEPLVWPESRTWEERPTREPGAEPLVGAEPPGARGGAHLFPPTPGDPVLAQAPQTNRDVQWQAAGDDADTTVHHDQALAGLGGGAEIAPAGASGDIGLISTSALPTPPVHPAAERSSEGPRWRRFEIRQGNAAVVGLISLVSLVLLGMFLSVRARNELPTDSSQSRGPSNQISVTGSLNTIPLTTTVTTTPPAAGINIADLLPALDAGAVPSRNATAADAGSGSGSPATTAAPSRAGTGSAGGGGSPTGATQPAASSPAPTSAPASSPTVEDSTPEETSPPPVDTTQPRKPTPTFTFPGFPTTTAPQDDEPSYDFPSWSDIED